MVAPLMTMPQYLEEKMFFGQAAELYLNYYTRIAWSQMCAANLLVEACNQQGNDGEATTQWQDFRSVMTAQEGSSEHPATSGIGDDSHLG